MAITSPKKCVDPRKYANENNAHDPRNLLIFHVEEVSKNILYYEYAIDTKNSTSIKLRCIYSKQTDTSLCSARLIRVWKSIELENFQNFIKIFTKKNY